MQHDFACGTGRAIRTLHGLVRAAHGYDTSAEMMAKAAEVGTRADFHQVPADGPVPSPVDAGAPAIVTMFRLLLNVDDAVRDRALAFAAKALPTRDAGLLVVENHGNASSVRHLRARRHSGERWFAELSHEQVADLLGRHGFEIVERRGLSMLTAVAARAPGRPGGRRGGPAAARLRRVRGERALHGPTRAELGRASPLGARRGPAAGRLHRAGQAGTRSDAVP